MKKRIAHYLRNSFFIVAILLIAVVAIGFYFFGNSKKPLETAIAKYGNIIESVSVTGKVTPFSKADLGFESSGIISKINVKVGDIIKNGDLIASLDSSDTEASLKGAQANLMAEKARLTELQNGLRPEEITIENAKIKSSEVAKNEARVGIINAFHDSYIKTENAVYNYADTFFTNPQTAVPTIKINVGGYVEETNINNQRVLVGQKLAAWKAILDSMTINSDPMDYQKDIHNYLEITKTFLSNLSGIISGLSTGSTGLTQASIDAYSLTMNTSLSTFNTAVAALLTGESAYSTASSNLTVAQQQFIFKKAGSSAEVLQAQMAKVEQAAATVSGYQAELAKKRIISPIDGIVSKVGPELGEFVSAGSAVFGVIGDQSYKVEINVPEVDIVKIAVNNKASITLDAYGEDIVFDAHVLSIDPAETIVEGVPTYKVTMQFDKKDDRVRSGMTANIDIITQSKNNVVVVPTRAVLEKNNQKYVLVLNKNSSSDYTEVPVVTGSRGSDGMIEIVSGISVDDKVITLLK